MVNRGQLAPATRRGYVNSAENGQRNNVQPLLLLNLGMIPCMRRSGEVYEQM